jgi:MoaA/NifB/PqqE/SkfB family radical SAM enzyme
MSNNVTDTPAQDTELIRPKLDLPEGIPPLNQIYLYVTGSCNLNCRHCYIEPAFGSKVKKYLPWSTLKPVFEEAQTLGLSRVKITGGEPFLHPEMCDILYELDAMGLTTWMETNGTLIGKREAKALKETNTQFSISIDGSTAEMHDDLRAVKGSFKRTMTGIEYAREEGLSFQIITCLHRKNRETLPDMVTLAQLLGANSLKVNPITDDGRGEEGKRCNRKVNYYP